MSIIQEALKKAEREIPGSGAGAAAAEPSATSAPAGPAGHASTSKAEIFRRPVAVARKASPDQKQDPKAVAILILLLVVTASLAASQLWGHKKGAASATVPAMSPAAEAPAAQELTQKSVDAIQSIVFQKQEEKKPANPDFTLNGIMYVEGAPRAIVNNAMVEIGDPVGDAKVIRIDRKSVVLQHDNAEIVLNLK